MKNKPLLLINVKTYPEALGKKGILLAKKLEKIKNKKFQIAIAPALLDIEEVAKNIYLPVFAQHTDPFAEGAHTGSVPLSELKILGVSGTLLNHSERKIPFAVLKETVALCKKFKLTTVVCASTLAEVKKVAQLKPEYLAYEPSELIGGNISVTTAKPEIITKAVQAVKKISPKTKVLCGAGVQNGEDVRKALELGAKGILVANAVVRAKNPEKVVEEMIK
ncbi:triose-phosphate isomerase [Candidatus Woesearchaeota archaeon]|nr:triose-phosphate isomerase [Candidatus Woesearchaeota archaeon]